MKKLTILASLVAMLFIGTQEATAQTSFQIGPRVGYEFDVLEELFLGAEARITTGALPIQINPSLDYYFVEGGSLFQLGVNGLYNFGFDNAVFTPYAGAGLGVAFSSPDEGESDTDFGVNLIGGAVFGFGSLRPFVQAQLTLGGDFEPASIVGGVLFSLGQ